MYIGQFNAFEFTAASDTAVNAVIKNGTIIGITRQPVASGLVGAAYTSRGLEVYSLPLASSAASAITAGTKVYFDSSNDITTTSTSNTYAGFLWKAAASGDTDVQVALDAN